MILDKHGNVLIARDDQFCVDDLRNALNFFGTGYPDPKTDVISGKELGEMLKLYITNNVPVSQAMKQQPVSRDAAAKAKASGVFQKVVTALNEGKTERCNACQLMYDPRKVMVIMGRRYCPLCQTELP